MTVCVLLFYFNYTLLNKNNNDTAFVIWAQMIGRQHINGEEIPNNAIVRKIINMHAPPTQPDTLSTITVISHTS